MTTTKEKKTPAKKATKPKAGGKASKPKQTAPALPKLDGGFDLLKMGPAVVTSARKLLTEHFAKAQNKPIGFRPLSEVRADLLPVGDFAFQYALGSYGLPKSTLIEIIAAEALGKSTLLCQIISWGIEHNCPALIVETENKPLQPERIMRTMSTDPHRAYAKMATICWDTARTQYEAFDKIEAWVDVMRNKVGVPRHIPLVVGVDSWSKLMSEVESAGIYNYGLNAAEQAAALKKYKDIGEGSNFGHAKFNHGLARRLPAWQGENNVVLIFTHHQNTKISMGATPGVMLPEQTAALYNKTHLGGNALNQNAAIQVILAHKGLAKDGSGNPRGALIQLRVAKNSYGPQGRKIEYELRNEHHQDSDEYLEPAIITSDNLAKFFADTKLLSTQADSKKYTCAALGVTGVSADEFAAKLHANPEVLSIVGKKLRLTGYFDAIAEVQKDIKAKEDAAAQAGAEQNQEPTTDAQAGGEETSTEGKDE